MTDTTPTPPPEDPGEELAVDIRAFLPEGVSLDGPDAADDDRPEPAVPAWALDAEPSPAPEATADPVPEADPVAEVEVIDHVEEAEPAADEVVEADSAGEVEVEAEVVPEMAETVTVPGIVVVDEPIADDEGPAVPAWALDESEAAESEDAPAEEPDVEVADEVDDDDLSPVDVDEELPEPEPVPAEEIDTSVLEQIEAELAEVEEALAAIDAGDLERSPLLVRLLADQP